MVRKESEDIPGTFVNVGSGRQSFYPDTLPPTRELPLDGDIHRIVSEATFELGRLNAISQTIDVSAVPYTSLLRREAVESTAIEGADVDVDEVFQYYTRRAGQEDIEVERDLQEVLNYEAAVLRGIEIIDEHRMDTIELLHEFHEMLLQGSARADTDDVGQFRSGYVRLGDFIPPASSQIELLVSDMQKYIQNEGQYHDLIDIALYHYQFETVHPYKDGNGRLGRLLITLQLYDKGYLLEPYFYPSAYFNRYKSEYVDRLQAVRYNGDWEGWIRFFLTGIRDQAGEAYQRTLQLRALREEYEQQYGAQRNAAQRLALHLFEQPYLTPSQAMSLLDGSDATVYRALNELVDDGVLEEITGKQKRKEYRATEIFAIIEQPPEYRI
jgi:Fic family protein